MSKTSEATNAVEMVDAVEDGQRVVWRDRLVSSGGAITRAR